MADLNFVLNCSFQKFPHNLSEEGHFNNFTSKSTTNEGNIKGLCTLSGILVAIIIDVLLIENIKHITPPLKNKLTEQFNAKKISRILVLTMLVLTLPLVSVVLLLALLYKILCSVVIMRKDKNFVSFLDSFDVFWSLEGDATKSVINVLGIVESNSPQAIARNIKEKLQAILTDDRSRKIFYRRNEEYGFYYWRRYSHIDMNEYVEIIEFPEKVDLNVSDMETVMTNIQDQSLPYNDEGLFKILITRQRVGSYSEERGEYGIIFRIHHSVGDGVALIEFLCQTFADKKDNCPVNMFAAPENCKTNSPYDILDMMHKLCEMPLCFVNGIVRKPDDNTFHGPTLSGKKIFKWTASDENLLRMVKEIKGKVNQLNFTDVVLAALSSGLRNFFSETMAPIPEDLAVILPVRFAKTLAPENDVILSNDFSVTILDLPVKGKGNVKEVKRRCNELRKSADPLANHYFLKLVCNILPRPVLLPLLNSSQATMVFSNMPGPDQLSICGGNALKSLVFFVPNKGNTGLGVTALCYGGVLRFAVMADAALVSKSEHLALILDGMVEEIKRLHQQYVLY